MPQKVVQKTRSGLASPLFGGSGCLPGVSWAPLGHSWVLAGRSWVPLGRFLGPLGHLLAGLGRLLGTCSLSGTPRSSNLGCFGSVQGEFGTPSGQVWARLLRTVAGSTSCALFHSDHSIQFRSVPIPSILFRSIPFHCLPYHSIPFDSISLPFTPHRSGVPGFQNSGVGCFRYTDLPVSRPRASNRPRRDSRSVNNFNSN